MSNLRIHERSHNTQSISVEFEKNENLSSRKHDFGLGIEEYTSFSSNMANIYSWRPWFRLQH